MFLNYQCNKKTENVAIRVHWNGFEKIKHLNQKFQANRKHLLVRWSECFTFWAPCPVFNSSSVSSSLSTEKIIVRSFLYFFRKFFSESSLAW